MDENNVTPPVEDPKTEPLKEETPKEEPKSAESVEDGIDVDQAKNLYKVLQDPKTAPLAIKALAENYGLKFDTPKQEQKSVRSLKQIVKDSLGTEYAFLAEKLGAAFEEALEVYDERVNSRVTELQKNAETRAAEEAFDWLYKEYSDAASLEKEMTALMDDFPIKPGTPAKSYLKRIYNLAKSERAEISTKKDLAKKITRNASDPDLALKKSIPGDHENSDSSKPMSIEDALRAAQRSLKL